MMRQSIYSFVFANEGVLPASHSGHVRCGTHLGEGVLWEWKYFHHHLQMRDQIWKWRDAQRHLGVFRKMQDEWGLGDFVIYGVAAIAIGLKEFMFTTAGLLAMLFELCLRPGPTNPSRREKAKTALQRLCTKAAAAIRTMNDHECNMRASWAGESFALHLQPDGSVSGFDKFAEVINYASIAAACSSKFVRLPTQPSEITFAELLFLAAWAVKAPLSIVGQLERAALGTLLPQLCSSTAFFIESYVVQQYLPKYIECTKERPELPQELRTRRGHRRRLDPIEVEAHSSKMIKICGSMGSISMALFGNLFWHKWLVNTGNRLYLRDLAAMFKGRARLSLAWDPGTYGGENTNVGLVCSIDSPNAGVMPIKARHLARCDSTLRRGEGETQS